MPTSSSGRSRRCSSFARSRLARSSGSAAATRDQRSTPPAASRRDTAATSWGQVSQYIVGKGSPFSSYGACSVTAGRSNGQRTTTRRNARGGLPSWRSTAARSLSTCAEPSVRLLPRLDALDDEEVLAGTDVPELPRLPRDAVEALRRVHALLQASLQRGELRHLVGT